MTERVRAYLLGFWFAVVVAILLLIITRGR